MTVLKHEKSGLTVDVGEDQLQHYTKNGWEAVTESDADAEAAAKAKSEAGGDAGGTDAGESDTTARQGTKRRANSSS